LAEQDTTQEDAPKKPSRLPLIAGLVGAVILGAGGFYVAWSGMFASSGHSQEEQVTDLPDIAFVPVDPVVISLPPGSASEHLRFTAQLEVAASHGAEVTMLLPRIADVLNGYLRAINVVELEDPTAFVRIRAQLLRRIQIVTGDGRVRDLLITEFVLN
jgi:flagellar protein FliL